MGPLNLPPADRAYRFASCELLLLYPAPSRTLRSPGPLWTRLRAGRASPLFATRALTLPPSVPLIRRTLFTCGRVNPIAPSIAGRRREYQRSKRARLFRREYFKQSSSNFQIYLCKECPSRPAASVDYRVPLGGSRRRRAGSSQRQRGSGPKGARHRGRTGAYGQAGTDIWDVRSITLWARGSQSR